MVLLFLEDKRSNKKETVQYFKKRFCCKLVKAKPKSHKTTWSRKNHCTLVRMGYVPGQTLNSRTRGTRPVMQSSRTTLIYIKLFRWATCFKRPSGWIWTIKGTVAWYTVWERILKKIIFKSKTGKIPKNVIF